jgi:hypothetical protein
MNGGAHFVASEKNTHARDFAKIPARTFFPRERERKGSRGARPHAYLGQFAHSAALTTNARYLRRWPPTQPATKTAGWE